MQKQQTLVRQSMDTTVSFKTLKEAVYKDFNIGKKKLAIGELLNDQRLLTDDELSELIMIRFQ